MDTYLVDPHSNTWKAIDAWAKAEVSTARDILDSQGVPERDADFARGKLFALRGLLKLANPSKIPGEL